MVPGEKGGWRIFPGFCSGLIIQFINGEKVELGLHFKDLGFCQILKIFLRPHLSSTSVTISNCVRSRGNWSKKTCRLGDQISGSEKSPARRVCGCKDGKLALTVTKMVFGHTLVMLARVTIET